MTTRVGISRSWAWVAMLLAGLLALAKAEAHVLNMTRAAFTVSAPQVLDVQIDIDLTLLLGDSHAYRELLTLPTATRDLRLQEAGRLVFKEVGVILDGGPLVLAPLSWTLPDTPPEKVGDQAVAAMTAFRYRTTLPATARELSLAPDSLAKLEFPLAYTYAVPATNLLMTRWLELPGATSRVFRLTEIAAAAAVMVSPPATELSPGRTIAPVATAAKADKPAPVTAADFTPGELAIARFIATAWQHLRLGFLHIFPRGADHVLFVLGLFFLGAKWKPLLSQTTAFTIAHTTTLGLSAYGIFSLPVRVVEPLIALSITYVAIENIVRPKLGPTRLAIVFAFGLLHGLGFASSLSEVPLPKDQFFTALLAFNFGVDFGQLAVIAMAFSAVGWFRDCPWYRQRIVIPGCVMIASIGLYWTVIRAFF